ncbi:MAG: choice-of-anchor I family protein [Fluviicoccus sp.]|uniref:choice-of-anchor I family protein n=1 Tax=Fluviicoccus sp. TaxID=2003552 RepID=UPI0027192476|nr:choice-of-anchor I family protein [Fluviicoccus sp.]MDO8330135.1 choice-of-anchor I family protein [Fluviicoccus sp.]
MHFLKKSLITAITALALTACMDDGDPGIAGKDGINGTNGANGSNGTNGSNGANGLDGKNGAGQTLALNRIARSASQGFNVSAAEIVAYDKTGKLIFTVNALSGAVDVFDSKDIHTNATLPLKQSLDLKQLLVDNGKAAGLAAVGGANSIAVSGNLVAVAVEANPKTDTGWVIFLNATTLAYVNAVSVGALPDMLTFTPDGGKLLVANEGEPNVGYTIDPEGSVSVINVSNFAVSTLGFTDFNVGGPRNSQLPLGRMVLSGVNASVAQDLEPEYLSVRADGKRAYVSLQENNALAVLNLEDNTVQKIIGLGFKDHNLPGNELDASQQDGVNLRTWPVLGMYMPDTISSLDYNGRNYVVTANEGDSREDWLNGLNNAAVCAAAGYYHKSSKCRDELALKDIADSDLVMGPMLAGLNTDSTLGRLKFSYQATKAFNGGVTVNKLYAYGSRSFAIWDAETGEQVFDSGNSFERITALRYGALFNQDHNGSLTGDKRSNSKGPEPEALAIGKIQGHTYAFIGLERMGGVMVYDISNPFAPAFVQYVNPRDVTVSPDAAAVAAGMDLGPEGMRFVAAADAPGGKPLLIVGNEVSGTTSVFEIAVTLLQE